MRTARPRLAHAMNDLETLFPDDLIERKSYGIRECPVGLYNTEILIMNRDKVRD